MFTNLFHYFNVKFIYSEKATTFDEISTLLLSYLVLVKSKMEISQNFVAFSEYMNFDSACKLCRTKPIQHKLPSFCHNFQYINQHGLKQFPFKNIFWELKSTCKKTDIFEPRLNWIYYDSCKNFRLINLFSTGLVLDEQEQEKS